MGLKSKVLVALSSLAIFLSPVFAQKIEEKPKEKTPFAAEVTLVCHIVDRTANIQAGNRLVTLVPLFI